ncbi:MAG: hypothetical protein B7Z74_07105 [Deltaproteobacteria bacterium 21-66-5]|nr:MAG: hypothetical protein B7Z74_07105 [Deltaproteobacteria bacterium 21-66-5]
MMKYIWSIWFNLIFYGTNLLMSTALSWSMLISRKATVWAVEIWLGTVAWVEAHLCGIRYRVIGRGNIPKGACIIAAKHQSAWETLALQVIFPPQAWVLKRELLWLPFFGWGLAMTSPIAIDREEGRAALKHHISGMGHHLTDAQLAEIYEKFLVLADKKKEVMVEDLEILVQDELFKVPETYKLVHLQILSGTKATPMAALKVQRNNEMIEEAAMGNGPIDAAYKCIERIVGANFQLIDFGLNAVTSGQDAIGEARVRIRSNGTIFSGGASSTDIIEAAIKAYLSAINRWVAAEAKTKPGKKGAAKKAIPAPVEAP